jgi:hypothetical protein
MAAIPMRLGCERIIFSHVVDRVFTLDLFFFHVEEK